MVALKYNYLEWMVKGIRGSRNAVVALKSFDEGMSATALLRKQERRGGIEIGARSGGSCLA